MPCKRAFPQACTRETVVSKTVKSQGIRSEDQIQLQHWSPWIHKTKNRVSNEKDSWRTHRGKRAEFCIALQIRAYIYSDAASDEDSRSKGSSGQGMEKAWDNSSMGCEKSQEQKGGHRRGTENNNKVHVASLMDFCHLKNSELEPQLQKYRGRVVLRGDIVKDGSGACAVFTEQGSSASQMTAAKVMDVNYLIVTDKQLTQYRHTPRRTLKNYFKFPNQNVRMYGYVFQNINGRNRGNTLRILLFLLKETCTDQDSCGKTVRKSIDGTWLGESTKLGMLVRSQKTKVVLIGLRGWH